MTDLDVVLTDPHVDIVSVCTPTPTHPDIAIRALRAGKNVLLEKPIALTVEQALAIAEAAEASGAVLMVAHVVRFFAGYRALKREADAGRFGRILSVRARRISAPGEQAPWMRDESQSGGILVDFGIHDFDQVNLYLGTPVAVTAVRAGASGPIETTVEYADGGIGQVLTHLSMPAGTPFTTSIELIGTGGLADYHFSDASLGRRRSPTRIRMPGRPNTSCTAWTRARRPPCAPWTRPSRRCGSPWPPGPPWPPPPASRLPPILTRFKEKLYTPAPVSGDPGLSRTETP